MTERQLWALAIVGFVGALGRALYAMAVQAVKDRRQRMASPPDQVLVPFVGREYATQAEIDRAREMYANHSDDDIEIDDIHQDGNPPCTGARVSVGDDGVWVSAWVWLRNEDDEEEGEEQDGGSLRGGQQHSTGCINVFEGARRIVKVVAVLWAVG